MGTYILANCTDTGKVRSVNEDSMITFDSPNGRIVVVCDGMGGQNAGDVASQLAVTVIQDILSDNTFPTPEEAITRSIIAANQAILRRASQDESLSGMGSTCVMVIIKDGKVYYGSVGDSRIYYVSNGMIRQITKDQSYVQTLVDEGKITQEAAEHHQDKNQITNALGVEGMTPPVICHMPIVPEPGSIFLLCSDGLSGMINNNTILTTLINNGIPLNERAQQLVNLANSAGGLDNITVQLIEFPMTTEAAAGNAYQINPTSGAYLNTKVKKNRNIMLLLIICLLLTVVIGGGIYWYLYNNNKPQQQVVAPVSKSKKTADKPQETETKESGKEKTITTVIIKEPKKETSKKKKNSKKEPIQKQEEKIINKDGSSENNKDLQKEMKPFTGDKEL